MAPNILKTREIYNTTTIIIKFMIIIPSDITTMINSPSGIALSVRQIHVRNRSRPNDIPVEYRGNKSKRQ